MKNKGLSVAKCPGRVLIFEALYFPSRICPNEWAV